MRSHHLPCSANTVPSNSYSSSPGPQTFKERMLDVVRSKERFVPIVYHTHTSLIYNSKMVNVSSKLPFHFHNKNQESDGEGVALAEPFSTSLTYSRSVSASSLPRDILSPRPFLPLSPMYETQFNVSPNSSITFSNECSTDG